MASLAVVSCATCLPVMVHASLTPATAGLAPAPSAPVVEERTLPDGVRVVLERRAGPRVAIEVVWPGGAAVEAAATAGATAVVAEAVTAACAPEAGEHGGILAARAGRRHLAVRGTWPAAAWRDGLAVARRCPASDPVLAGLVAARERVARDRRLAGGSAVTRAAALALEARWRVPALATGVASPGREALRGHRAAVLAPAPVVAVVGDVTMDELAVALAVTDEAPPPVTGLPAASASARLASPPTGRPAGPATGATDEDGPRPRSRQLFAELAGDDAAVALAFAGLPAAHPDRAALEVLATLLADPAGPLAGAGLRSVALVDVAGGGLVLTLGGPPPLARSLSTAEWALARLAADGPEPAAVDAARAALLARLARPDVRAAALARATLAGAPEPAAALAAVDAAAVARVAAGLHLDDAVIATVQPPARTPAVDRLMRGRPSRTARPPRSLRRRR